MQLALLQFVLSEIDDRCGGEEGEGFSGDEDKDEGADEDEGAEEGASH